MTLMCSRGRTKHLLFCLVTALPAACLHGQVEVTEPEIDASGSQGLADAYRLEEFGGSRSISLLRGEIGRESRDWVDVYAFHIEDPAGFSAVVSSLSLPPDVAASEPFDTQLFLFNEDGFGVIANDEDDNNLGAAGSFASAIPPDHVYSPTVPGTYYLALTVFDNDPVSEGNPGMPPQRIFPGDPPHIVQCCDGEAVYGTAGPTGPGGLRPFQGWDFAQIIGPHFLYEIRLTGAETIRRPVSFQRGEVNGDGAIDLSDTISILLLLFVSTGDPLCLDAMDSDDSGATDISDAVYLLNYLFLGEAEPPPPFEPCGEDTTPDDLGCEPIAQCP